MFGELPYWRKITVRVKCYKIILKYFMNRAPD